MDKYTVNIQFDKVAYFKNIQWYEQCYNQLIYYHSEWPNHQIFKIQVRLKALNEGASRFSQRFLRYRDIVPLYKTCTARFSLKYVNKRRDVSSISCNHSNIKINVKLPCTMVLVSALAFYARTGVQTISKTQQLTNESANILE